MAVADWYLCELPVRKVSVRIDKVRIGNAQRAVEVVRLWLLVVDHVLRANDRVPAVAKAIERSARA